MKNWKKCLALVFAVILCSLSAITVFAEIDNFINADWDKDYESGDGNGDGNVNSDAILLIRKYIAGLVGDADIEYDAADVNLDSSVNSDDLLIIRKMVAGLV